MMTLQIILGLFVLGILVIIHEFGHFLTAKLFGIRVLSFSIGFGRPLIKKTFGETEYRISAIPFGGYVHMAGEHPDDEQSGAENEFQTKPIWQRALVAIGGPFFNYASAVVLLCITFIVGVEKPLYLDKAVVGDVKDSSFACLAGILPGDIVYSANGTIITSWHELEDVFSKLAPSCSIEIIREGSRLDFELPGLIAKGAAIPREHMAGLLPPAPPVIGSTRPDSPSETAGILPGDSIISINGRLVHSWFHLSSIISRHDSASGPMTITLYRAESLIDVDIAPEFDVRENRYLIGITMATPPMRIIRSGIISAVAQSFTRSWEIVESIGDVLKKLVVRDVSPRQLAGPVGIIQMSGGIALLGLVPILSFMALISINLALLNLLPLVITDGGLLLFLVIEAIRGKPISLKHQLLVNKIAISFFILLFLYVTFNDILRIPQLFRLSGR